MQKANKEVKKANLDLEYKLKDQTRVAEEKQKQYLKVLEQIKNCESEVLGCYDATLADEEPDQQDPAEGGADPGEGGGTAEGEPDEAEAVLGEPGHAEEAGNAVEPDQAAEVDAGAGPEEADPGKRAGDHDAQGRGQLHEDHAQVQGQGPRK